jgi:hypothetical protein
MMNKQYHDYKMVPYPKLRHAGSHASFSPAQADDPWPNRRRCDQSPRVFAGTQSEKWGVLILHGLHFLSVSVTAGACKS